MTEFAPFRYAAVHHKTFAGLDSDLCDRAASRIAVLPIPVEQPFSRQSGSAQAPAAIIRASVYMDWWDEEVSADVHLVGIHTLEPVTSARPDTPAFFEDITRVAEALGSEEKFVVALGGDASISLPLVRALKPRFDDLSILVLGAHANLHESMSGQPFHDGCAARRLSELAPCVQVGVRSLSFDEAAAVQGLDTTIVFAHEMQREPGWTDRIVERLGPRVYVSVDCSVLDPSVMPAVARPQPDGLTWRETTALLRAVFAQRQVVGCDLVGHTVFPGLVAPTFLCAKLAYKMMTYAFPTGNYDA